MDHIPSGENQMVGIGHVLIVEKAYHRKKQTLKEKIRMSDFVHIMPGQVSVICPNQKCKQLAVTGSHSYYRCSYCGTNMDVKKCIYRGRNYKNEEVES